MKFEKILVFSFGVVFVSVILALVVFLPEPTTAQYVVFKTVLAIAAADVGAMLPGLLEVQINNFIRAGGAMAIFAVVYFYSPALIEQTRSIIVPKKDMDETLSEWLSDMDSGEFVVAYKKLCDDSKKLYTQAQFVSLAKDQRAPLGEPTRRTRTFMQGATNPPGRTGTFSLVGYATIFKNNNNTIAEHIFLEAKADSWRVCEYNLIPQK